MGDSGPTIAWVSLALALVGGLLALLRYINSEITQERKWREEADDIEREAREKVALDDQNRYSLMYREFVSSKLEASEKFAPYSAIEKLEERLVTAIEKLGARQETMLGRMEVISSELAKSRRSSSS